MQLTALKPVFDRATQQFSVEVLRDANPLHVHDGYFVYDDAAIVLPMIKRKALLGKRTKRLDRTARLSRQSLSLN